MTGDEKYAFAEDWIREVLRDLPHIDLVEALMDEYDIDDGGETATEILDIIEAADIEITWGYDD